MPSFLNDHNTPIYGQNSGVLHLNGANQYEGIANIKVNGQVPHQVTSHTSNDSFGGSSSRSSTHTSDTSDAAPHTNGNDTRTSTMSTTVLHNGVTDGEGGPVINKVDYYDDNKKQQQLLNGAPVISSLPDRSVSPRSPLPNGTTERTSSNMSYAEPPSIRTSVASGGSGSVQPSPIGMPIHHFSKGDVVPIGSPHTIANFQPSSPGNQRSSLDPNSSAQRFSSPAQMSGNTGFSASTSNLHPANAGLKHRHTLEVPRPGQPRGSRDGMDTALASGRFSPTGTASGSGVRRASLSLVRRNTRSMHSDFPRDEAFPDEDAMRWAEAYRQKRASKRKKKEEEDDDRVLVGTKVDEKHANWVTAYNMLTGIRVAVSRTNAKLDRPLTDADFEAKQKSTFDM